MPTRAPSLVLSGDTAADELLSRDPLALLIGMVLDQQIPLERAFRSPLDLKERMGGRLDAADIAGADPDELRSFFAKPPALHRFPGSMAARVQEVCRVLVEEYGGQAEALWRTASTGPELLRRGRGPPRLGDPKATVFLAPLGEQLRGR